jgi:biopolymer transport protein TolR
MAGQESGRQGSPRSRRRLVGEINVVPYIDVMLVLLVIFMVTAPLLTQGIEVDLPEADTRPVDTRDHEPVVLTVNSRGELFLDAGGDPRRVLEAGEVQRRVAALLRRDAETPVLVRADARVPYGEVVKAMALLQGAGATKLGFLTDPPGMRPPR